MTVQEFLARVVSRMTHVHNEDTISILRTEIQSSQEITSQVVPRPATLVQITFIRDICCHKRFVKMETVVPDNIF